MGDLNMKKPSAEIMFLQEDHSLKKEKEKKKKKKK